MTHVRLMQDFHRFGKPRTRDTGFHCWELSWEQVSRVLTKLGVEVDENWGEYWNRSGNTEERGKLHALCRDTPEGKKTAVQSDKQYPPPEGLIDGTDLLCLCETLGLVEGLVQADRTGESVNPESPWYELDALFRRPPLSNGESYRDPAGVRA
jgi:hypothetical protein